MSKIIDKINAEQMSKEGWRRRAGFSDLQPSGGRYWSQTSRRCAPSQAILSARPDRTRSTYQGKALASPLPAAACMVFRKLRFCWLST